MNIGFNELTFNQASEGFFHSPWRLLRFQQTDF